MLKRKISLGLIVVLVMNLLMSMGALAAGDPTIKEFKVNDSGVLDDIAPKMGRGADSRDIIALTFDQPVLGDINNFTLKGVYLSDSTTPNRTVPEIVAIEAQDANGNAVVGSTTTPFTKIIIRVKELSLVSKYTLEAPSGTFASADDGTSMQAIKQEFKTGDVPNILGRNPLTPAPGAAISWSDLIILKMKFNQNINLVSGGKIKIMSTENDSLFHEISVDSQDVTVNGDEVTIKVTGMKKGSGYYVVIGPQVFLADNGLDYSGIGSNKEWSFSINAENNISWLKTTPIDGATNVSPTTNLIFNFPKALTAGTGSITINRVNSNSTTTTIGTIPVSSNAVTVQGTNGIQVNLSSLSLANDTTYQVTVPAGAFKDTEGNTTVARTWSFTTGAATTLALSIVSLNPSRGSTNVALTTKPTATFDRDISIVNFANSSGITLRREDLTTRALTTVSSTVVASGRNLIITPTSGLQDNSIYYVEILQGAIVDASNRNISFSGLIGLSYPDTWKFQTGTTDKIAPVIQDATMYNNNTIRLRYNEALYVAGSLSTSYFTVTVNGENRRISSAYTSGEYVYVTLDLGIAVGQVVRISYNGSGTNYTIQDLARNAAAGFSNREVTNNIDSVLPKPRDGYVNGNTVYLSFTESLKSVSSNAYGQFTVTANGSTKSIRSISSSGSSVYLTLDSGVGNGEVVKVSYQPGSYPLQDYRNNNIAPFSDYFVRNYNDTIPPEFQSVEGAGNKIILTYNEPLRTTPLPLKSQFSVLVNNVAVYVTNVEIVSNQIILTLASSFTQEQAVTLSYVSGYGGAADLNGNLAGFINLQQVTYNNVAQGIRSAVINGDVITITYNATLRAVSFLPPNQFAVMVNNNPVGVQTATVSGNTVTLKLSTQVTTGQTVSLSYMTGTTPLIDTSGNKLNTFSSMTVTHSSTTSNTTTTNGQPNFLSIMTSSTFNRVGYILNISTAKTSTTQSNRGRSINRYTIDSVQMQTAFKFLTTLATNRMLVFEVPQSERAAEVAIPLSALSTVSGGNQNVSFAVKYKENLYEVPIDGISLSEITRALNVNTLNSAYLIIQMEPIERSQLGMPTVSNGVSISTLIDPIEIRIVVINGSGSANGGANIKHSGKYYLRMNGSRVTAAQSTLVNYNTSINAMEHMLSSTSGSNGNLLYTAKVEGNSIIGPIMGSIFYSDINSHWAKADINELTSKLVVGPRSTGAITFDANRNITRGEFGEYIAKALGLTSDISSNSFPDVSANIRGGYINSAVKAGIITGYPDGTFKPEQFITREQMALMMVRAMSYANENITLNGTSAQTLSRFRDSSGIQDKETVAKAVQSGIIQGITATSFQPKGNATRAQAVVMIRRVLSKINYL